MIPRSNLPAIDLIADTEAALRQLIAPGGPDARYQSLLAANALATAQRELSLPPVPAVQVDPPAIRAGAHDTDALLYTALLDAARRRAWVADPAALAPSDCALIEGEFRD